jgi:hypothetical protein
MRETPTAHRWGLMLRHFLKRLTFIPDLTLASVWQGPWPKCLGRDSRLHRRHKNVSCAGPLILEGTADRSAARILCRQALLRPAAPVAQPEVAAAEAAVPVAQPEVARAAATRWSF